MNIPAGIEPEYIKNRFWRAYMLGMRTAREIDKSTSVYTTVPTTESFLKIYKDRIQTSLQNKSSKEEYAKLPKLKWLLSDSDFEDTWNKDKEWEDAVLHILWDNGITSPADAKCRFEFARFEYTKKDCPKCVAFDDHYELTSSHQWKCKKCGHKFTITSGTYIDNTKLELFYWWRFAYLIGEMKITNSQVIAKDLDVTQATSWFMIETLRNARKQTSDKNFVNGQEVLVFNHLWEVIELLVRKTSIKKKKNTVKIKKEIVPVTPTEKIKKAKVHYFLNQTTIEK